MKNRLVSDIYTVWKYIVVLSSSHNSLIDSLQYPASGYNLLFILLQGNVQRK